MAMAKTVESYLQQCRIPYTVMHHAPTHSSRETAQAAHVPAERLAKAVVLLDHGQYVMAVIPASRHLGVETLSQKLGRPLTLAAENRLAPVFKDCDLGAIPPLGPAYGMETIVDDELVDQPEIYFEAGDHEDLIRVDGKEFLALLKEAQYGQLSH